MVVRNTPTRYHVAAQEDRSAPRTRLAIPAQFRQSGGRAFQASVLDLSLSGFAASSISRLQPGTICWLTLPGLESLQAEVVWWDDGIAGCAFQQLLNPIVHDNIIALYSGSGSGPRPAA
ncbi:PilZ domain-containing protein [Tsuneonella sp. CC-YZS046]|uniref:PilZ domain-containing protein n=1 Tax=Tsuneonella sp. CC-YZS046 TaxID=3042152 RepID=UPI002D78F188|nr:PilZ domain-containing protein [Tsuneonella sp. CC-YZS046]WRO67886.1 PilZ domain-containing protein [Tsuneonella sp. CC-YZS046]